MEDKIIEKLSKFGLNTYEAKAYYVLLTSGEMQASSIARAARIPSQRIYDILNSLEKKGFIQTKYTTPKKFIPVPLKQALDFRIKQIKLDFEKKEKELETVKEELSKINIPAKNHIGSQISILEGNEAITSKALEMLQNAKKLVKICGVKPLYVLGCKGNLRKYLKNKVKVFAIGDFDTECIEEIEKTKGKCKIKEVPHHYILIVDDKKLLVVYFDNDGLPYGFYTDNLNFLIPYITYFDTLWHKN